LFPFFDPQFLLCLFVGVATAAQLPNSYIPPNRASAGGNGQFLQAPRGGQPNNQYIPPSTGSGYDASAQSNQYAQGGQGGQGGRGSTTYASAQSADAQATILKYENNPNIGDGTYSYE
jgi:hypothetical protein